MFKRKNRCSQCRKDAFVRFGSKLLCVDCYEKLQRTEQLRVGNAKIISNILHQEMNHNVDYIESITGLRGTLPKYEIPKPIIHQGPMTFHNIQVDNSIIGSINSGYIQSIDIAMNDVTIINNFQLAKSLKQFTEAILNDKQLQSERKNDLLEQVSFLANEAIQGKGKRKNSIAVLTLKAIRDTVATSAGLATLWNALEPLLKTFF